MSVPMQPISSTHNPLETKGGLARIATGRDGNLFMEDLEHCRGQLLEMLEGKRILVIGGAGSIGSATIAVLTQFNPACLHVIDHDENGLAELVRHLRSRKNGLDIDDFATLPIDFSGLIARRFLRSQATYDLVLNFAAIKHVRSEKDPFSTLQMFETNISKQAHFVGFLNELGFSGRYFAVSTDKAANPSSMMGASKRAMEHILFSEEVTPGLKASISSARFANVAFSNGSLLQAFEQRLKQRQPLAVPKDVRRYFVSMEEAGTLCTLASAAVGHNNIVIPRLNPEDHLVPLTEIAIRFLEGFGLKPHIYDNEDEARSHFDHSGTKGSWPLLVTPLDTAGEKPYEEFVAKDETVIDIGMPNLEAVRYKPAAEGRVARFLAGVNEILGDEKTPVTSQDLESLLVDLEPAFAQTRRRSEKSLDQRM
jgi:FlaA1/EpsC-like NDP-sugar epimerase